MKKNVHAFLIALILPLGLITGCSTPLFTSGDVSRSYEDMIRTMERWAQQQNDAIEKKKGAKRPFEGWARAHFKHDEKTALLHLSREWGETDAGSYTRRIDDAWIKVTPVKWYSHVEVTVTTRDALREADEASLKNDDDKADRVRRRFHMLVGEDR